MINRVYTGLISITAIIFLMAGLSVYGARVKDVADIQGITDIQVIGYGLVTGLNNTGDNQRSSFTVQSVSNLLKRFGITIPQSNPRVRNVAAVMVTATIPSFLKKGAKIDVQVSSIGDANSLQGGVLLMTPMSLANGNIIGMAQGGVSVGGYDFRALGSRVGKNFVTTGRVPNGLILDAEVEGYGQYLDGNTLRIMLRDPDFSTAFTIATAINNSTPAPGVASPIDAATVEVEMTAGLTQMQLMENISFIERIDIQVDVPARVVINERTGTVVVGGNVQLLPSVIAHGGLEIHIQKNYFDPTNGPLRIRLRNAPDIVINPPSRPPKATILVSPPKLAELSDIDAEEENNPSRPITIDGTATVADMAEALNSLKVKPRDLIAIFQALKESGALQGELIIQ